MSTVIFSWCFQKSAGKRVYNINNIMTGHNSNFSTTALEHENQFENYICPLHGKEGQLARVAKITALIVIIAVSLIGNLLIIIVTRRTARMRKVAFNFIVNMAIADLCTTIINMPESLFVEIKDSDEWISGDIGIILCKLLPFCQQVCSFCSILSLLTIAFDNFFAICLPLKNPMTRKLSRIIITSTWLIPCITSVPMFLANNVVESEGILLCLEEWLAPFDSLMASRTYTVILFSLFYMVPLISISVLYSCVFYKILNRKVLGNHSAKTQRLYSRSRRKAMKMFVAIVVCFALCWLPDHVTYFLISYNDEFYNCGLPRNIDFISLFFAYAISALNPCIYIVLNQQYRNGAKRLLTNCWKL